MVVATDAMLHDALSGADPGAEAVMAQVRGAAAGFALFVRDFSTGTKKAGLFVADLYVTPVMRGHARFERSVLDRNAPAIASHRAMGAVGMDAWTVRRIAGPAPAALAARDRRRG